MDKTIIKTIFNFGVQLILFGLIFNIAETILFLFLEGWHTVPTNHLELTCDYMARIVMDIGWFIMLFASFATINRIINDK